MDLQPSSGRKKTQVKSSWTKRLSLILPLLCLVIFGTVVSARLLARSGDAHAATLVSLKGHIPALVKTSTLLGETDKGQSLSLSIGLKLRNADSLKNYVDIASEPDTTTKKHLSRAEIAAGYAPLASSEQAVIDYLQSYGFKVTLTLSQHLVIGVQGTVGQAEDAFHVTLNNYKSESGQQFYAPDRDPSLPGNLAAVVQSVTGLNNVAHFKRPPTQKQPQSVANVSANGVTCPAPSGGNPYWPSQIASAYDLNGFYNAGFRGEGQSVALVEFDDYNAADISTYANSSCGGGASVPIHKVLVDGGPGAPGAAAFEDELDMELILGTAPRLAGLYVYEAPNSIASSNDLWARIINDDAIPVVSTSWGICERDMSQADLSQENALFTLAAAQGQTIFASSGDDGNRAMCGDGTLFQLGVSDPSSQPYVTAVGGTSLTLGQQTYGSESVWNNAYGASGGGLSSIWARPAWQQGPGVIDSNKREVPDVSLNADPNTGYLIYCTVAATGCDTSVSSWWSAGGTSASAPMWAAFMALTNQKTLADGGFNIGFINPYLYQIAQNAGGAYNAFGPGFHDITTGTNDTFGAGKYAATTGYDLATGLGSFDAWNLGRYLEMAANAENGSRGAPASTTWYFAEGSVGGTFTEYLTLLNPSANQTAHVSVQYLFENRAAVTKTYTVAPSTRFTTTVNNDLGIQSGDPQQAISAIVTSDVGIVAERPMYFNRPNELGSSGTDVLGATDASQTTFYFAAGDSSQSSNDSTREFITILNPNNTTANLTATFYSNGQVVDTRTLSVQPLHRGTIEPAYHGKASIKVTSDVGVVVERPIYFKVNVPTAGGTITGAASTVAATVPGNDWLFAEGHTADGFQENLVLANFDTNATTATIKLEYANGSVQSVPVTLNGQSQLTFDVNNAFQHPLNGCGCTPTSDVSIEVVSAAPIVAERVMYFKYKGSITGGTDVVGEAGPASHSIYSFAEGYTNSSFEEWLTLQNPNAHAEVVAITLFFDGTIVQKEVTLKAQSRTTFNINDIVVPVAKAYPAPNGGDGYNVSINVQVFDGGSVVAERPLYFKFMGTSPGGTDIIGYTGN